MRTWPLLVLTGCVLISPDEFDAAYDLDSDGYYGPLVDCDDNDPAIHPGAEELPGDEIDSNCNGVETCYADVDGDGFGTFEVEVVALGPGATCVAGSAAAPRGGDCDDGDWRSFPGAEETIGPGDDRDCDGTVLCLHDADGDGAGAPCSTVDCAVRVVLDGPIGSNPCDAPAKGAADDSGDCDDDDPSVQDLHPYARDADGDGFGTDELLDACGQPDDYVPAGGPLDCDDSDPTAWPGNTEQIGDGTDGDCDGFESCWIDGDEDGTGSDQILLVAIGSDCTERFTSPITGDCHDDEPSVPDPTERIDAFDNDCDGIWRCFADADADGFGGAAAVDQPSPCDAGHLVPSDCDDDDPTIGEWTLWFVDQDGDGYGDPLLANLTCDPNPDEVDNSSDCNDDDPGICPTTVWYQDQDGDGFGGLLTNVGCAPPPGRWTHQPGDCDDTDEAASLECPYVAMSSGGDHTCALRSNGELACFGLGLQGDILLAPEGAFTQVAAGPSHTCARDAGGHTTCWGNLDADCAAGWSLRPGATCVGTDIVGLAVEDLASSCALLSGTRALACWSDASQPAVVDEAPSGTFIDVATSATDRRACVVHDDLHTVSCWAGGEPNETVVLPAPISAIAPGARITCALTAHAAWCWGPTIRSQHGATTTTEIVRLFEDISSLDVSRDTVCVVTTAGELRCTGDIAAPPAGDRFQAVSLHTRYSFFLGEEHNACATRQDNSVACWGRRSGPVVGPATRVADSLSVSSNSTCVLRDGRADCVGQVRALPELHARSLVAGRDHYCVLRTSGDTHCWGAVETLQVPDATSLVASKDGACALSGASPTRPTCVGLGERLMADDVVAVDFAETDATCGLLSDGSVWCADQGAPVATGLPSHPGVVLAMGGAEGDGRWACVLDDGTLHCDPSPVTSSLSDPGTPVLQLSSAPEGACTLDGTGAVRCLHHNGTYQTHAGPNLSVSASWSSLLRVADDHRVWEQVPGQPEQLVLEGDVGAVLAATEQDSVCIVDTDQTVRCFLRPVFSPDVTLHGLVDDPFSAVRWSRLEHGRHFTCGLAEDGRIFCGGANDRGQVDPPAGDHVGLTTGDAFACAWNAGGEAVCWGDDRQGQSSWPVNSSGTSWRQLAAGSEHVCGLAEDGTVACIGRDDEGQATPPALTGVTWISAAEHRTCAVAQGTITCWGADHHGAGQIPSGLWRDVSTGAHHTCATDHDGAATCWGLDSWGQVSEVPQVVFSQPLALGNEHTCGISAGVVWCWGRDLEGQTAVAETTPPNTCVSP